MNCDPDALAEAAKCLCFAEGMDEAVTIYLLCLIADNWPEEE